MFALDLFFAVIGFFVIYYFLRDTALGRAIVAGAALIILVLCLWFAYSEIVSQQARQQQIVERQTVQVHEATAVAVHKSEQISAAEQLKRAGSIQVNYTSRTGDFGSYINVDHVEFAADGIRVYVRAKPYIQTTAYSTLYWRGNCPYNGGPQYMRCHESGPNISLEATRTQISHQDIDTGYLLFDYAAIEPGQRYYLLFGGGFWFDPVYLFTAPGGG